MCITKYDMQVNRALAPILFFLFVIFCVFVLLNMFLAVLNDSYEVMHNLKKVEDLGLEDELEKLKQEQEQEQAIPMQLPLQCEIADLICVLG